MRHAVLALLLVALLPHPARAGTREGPMDAIGNVDYDHGPRFKVGDWVKYRTRGESLQGFQTDYTVILLIAGEEVWWGEKCFWLETHTFATGDETPQIAASLLSYSVFEDSLPARRFTLYVRKTIDGLDENGQYAQVPFRRAETDIKRRVPLPDPEEHIDTLGVGRVEVPKGAFDALKVKRVVRRAVTAQEGDSTVYYERIEDHVFWKSDQIPITRLVKTDIDNTQRRRVWMIGESKNAPLNVAEHASGVMELLDYGSGMESTAIPERFRRPVREPRVTPSKSTRRPAGKRG